MLLRRHAAVLKTGNVGGLVPGLSGGGMGGPPGTSHTRYNPVFDDLSRGTIAEDMIPKDQRGLNRLLRLIYMRDGVGGPGVDIIKELLSSDFNLSNVKDHKKLQIYEDAKDAIPHGLQFWMPEIAGEWLVMGRVVYSLIFDGGKGHWTNILIHDPDYLDIQSIPIAGVDAKIDLLPPPDLQKFVRSRDPRDIAARSQLTPQTVRLIMSGKRIPLNPDNTGYLRRRGYPGDPYGMSLYSRMIPILAVEKALMNGTISAVRRWIGPRLHITAGIPDQWEPKGPQLQELVDLFMRSEEDPLGSITATRHGVEVNNLGGGKGQFWSLSDEWDMLVRAKLQAIGMNEQLITGDTTYNSMEHARSMFIERVKSLRSYFKDQVIIGKFYKTLAEVHGFYKRTAAELAHRVRTTAPTEEQLDLPEIEWNKQLNPESDTVYLDVLKVAEEKKIPVPVRVWASACGLDYDKVMTMLESDIKERMKIAEWRKRVEAFGGLTEGGPDSGAEGKGGAGKDGEPGTGDDKNAKQVNDKLPSASDIPSIHAGGPGANGVNPHQLQRFLHDVGGVVASGPLSR